MIEFKLLLTECTFSNLSLWADKSKEDIKKEYLALECVTADESHGDKPNSDSCRVPMAAAETDIELKTPENKEEKNVKHFNFSSQFIVQVGLNLTHGICRWFRVTVCRHMTKIPKIPRDTLLRTAAVTVRDVMRT